MLEIKNLFAGYRKLGVLKKVNINVNPNEIISLIGPNGAGKSTVIKSVFSIADVYKGKIFFKEKDITKLPTHELLELGISYVPQGRINFSEMTVEDNLKIGGNLIADKEVLNKQLDMVYKKFPILKKKKKEYAFSLSGGQQQMLALGRALIQNPSLLMLDEPSLGLSPKLQKQLFKTIQQLKDDGISVMIVEQNAKKAIEISDRTYLLENGEIVLEGGKDILKHKKIKNVYLGGV